MSICFDDSKNVQGKKKRFMLVTGSSWNCFSETLQRHHLFDTIIIIVYEESNNYVVVAVVTHQCIYCKKRVKGQADDGL